MQLGEDLAIFYICGCLSDLVARLEKFCRQSENGYWRMGGPSNGRLNEVISGVLIGGLSEPVTRFAPD